MTEIQMCPSFARKGFWDPIYTHFFFFFNQSGTVHEKIAKSKNVMAKNGTALTLDLWNALVQGLLKRVEESLI